MFKLQMMIIFDTYQQFALESNPHPFNDENEKKRRRKFQIKKILIEITRRTRCSKNMRTDLFSINFFFIDFNQFRFEYTNCSHYIYDGFK